MGTKGVVGDGVVRVMEMDKVLWKGRGSVMEEVWGESRGEEGRRGAAEVGR